MFEQKTFYVIIKVLERDYFDEKLPARLWQLFEYG